MRIDSNGVQYIEATNPTAKTYSLTITYTEKFADGKRSSSETVAILEPGQTVTAFKCSIKAPTEEIYDVKIIKARVMNEAPPKK